MKREETRGRITHPRNYYYSYIVDSQWVISFRETPEKLVSRSEKLMPVLQVSLSLLAQVGLALPAYHTNNLPRAQQRRASIIVAGTVTISTTSTPMISGTVMVAISAITTTLISGVTGTSPLVPATPFTPVTPAIRPGQVSPAVPVASAGSPGPVALPTPLVGLAPAIGLAPPATAANGGLNGTANGGTVAGRVSVSGGTTAGAASITGKISRETPVGRVSISRAAPTSTVTSPITPGPTTGVASARPSGMAAPGALLGRKDGTMLSFATAGSAVVWSKTSRTVPVKAAYAQSKCWSKKARLRRDDGEELSFWAPQPPVAKAESQLAMEPITV